jgi:hypothetical protein
MVGLRDWGWMTADRTGDPRSTTGGRRLRLCNHCLTFRPGYTSIIDMVADQKSENESSDNRLSVDEYWSRVEGCEISNFWIQKTGWVFGEGRWNKVVHDVSILLPELGRIVADLDRSARCATGTARFLTTWIAMDVVLWVDWEM